jgi:hypothetical protein
MLHSFNPSVTPLQRWGLELLVPFTCCDCDINLNLIWTKPLNFSTPKHHGSSGAFHLLCVVTLNPESPNPICSNGAFNYYAFCHHLDNWFKILEAHYQKMDALAAAQDGEIREPSSKKVEFPNDGYVDVSTIDPNMADY